MTIRQIRSAGVAALVLGLLTPVLASSAPVLFSGDSGVGDVDAALLAFRSTLGDPVNGNAPGPLGSGRREINWDGGGGVTTTATAGTPFNGFQNSRGASFTTPGTGFAQATEDGFGTLVGNGTYGTTFEPFSQERLFSQLGSTIFDVTFSIPGSGGAVPAVVSGFGAVFSDVDFANTTTLEFFALGGASLGAFPVPAVSAAGANLNETFSFLGVLFDAGEQVERVRVTAGNFGPGPNDNLQNDVVLTDDVIYPEPQVAVPEPATITLVLAGLGAAALRRRRSQ
jgi:hypothetical protein